MADQHEIELNQVSHPGSRVSQSSATMDARSHVDEAEDDTNHSGTSKRQVRHKLKEFQIFFISFSGVVGVGVYLRSAYLLQIGGLGAVIFCTLTLAALSWMVMQCITELICIWPIPGALFSFPAMFIDQDLGTVVGAAYWASYAFSFAAINTAIAAAISFWRPDQGGRIIEGLVICGVAPVGIWMLNRLGVQYYGWLEVGGGTVKLILIIVLVVMMGVINTEAGIGTNIISSNAVFDWDHANVENYAQAFLTGLSIAAFGFIGIEIPAVTALEAERNKRRPAGIQSRLGVPTMLVPDPTRVGAGSIASGAGSEEITQSTSEPARYSKRNKWTWWWTQRAVDGSASDADSLAEVERQRDREEHGLATKSLRRTAIHMPAIAGVLYLLAGFMLCLDVPQNDPNLPMPSWLNRPNTPISGFVLSAQRVGMHSFANAFTAFLIIFAISTSNTTLYVASRTLYTLTADMRRSNITPGLRGVPYRLLLKCNKINEHGVPSVALFVSAFAFIWVPAISLQNNSGTSISTILGVFSEMASNCCIVVWAVQCWSWLRFYKYAKKHATELERQEDGIYKYLIRDTDSYPFQSSWAPAIAWFALFGCFFILFIANSAPLWKDFTVSAFISSYFTQFILMGVWCLLKLFPKDKSNSLLDPRGRQKAWMWLRDDKRNWLDVLSWCGRDFEEFGSFKKYLDALNNIRKKNL